MKCLIFSVVSLFFYSNLHAQGSRSLGLTLKSGMSELKRISGEDDFYHPNKVTTSPSFTWGILIDAEKQFSKFISGQSQFGYNNIRGYETESYSATNAGTGETTEFRSETERNAHCLSLNTTVNIHPAEKLIIGLGISINYLLSNSYLTHGYSNNQPSYIIGGGNDLLQLDLGLNPQIGYQLFDKVKVYAGAQFGLFNIRDPKIQDSYSREFGLASGNEIILKSRLYTIGLNYTLFKDKV